jgi:hypothetical protein
VFELEDALLQPSGERDAAGAESNQDERADAGVALDDLVSQAGHGAANIVGAEQLFLARFSHRHSLRDLTGSHLKGVGVEVYGSRTLTRLVPASASQVRHWSQSSLKGERDLL